MKKANNFKVGDKVFAKVKGYPPWPAHIIAENGKKYNVEFYGTGETGVIKVEDLAYYSKNKQRFQKPLKRKDYVDAFEQIEGAIKEDGGDGDTSTNADDSMTNEDNVSISESDVSLNESTKVIKKTVKRKRSHSDKSTESAPSPKKKSINNDKSEEVVVIEDLTLDSSIKGGKENIRESKEFESVLIEDVENSSVIKETETQGIREKLDPLDVKIELVSEKTLKNGITYANYVKEKEAIYKEKPVEPREDNKHQILPVKLPSGTMGGIKLHAEWPLKFGNEYDRALYDESVAVRVLEDKQKIESGSMDIANNQQLFIPNIGMSHEDVTECLYLKDIDSKKARIKRLNVEAELMHLDSKIKNCLGLDKADPKEAIIYLKSMYNIDFDDLMLKKHPHVVEMVRRLRKYVGNTKEWNLSEESLDEFSTQAEVVRSSAEKVYAKFKKVVKVPEGSISFWEGYTDLLTQFRTDCMDMTDTQIYLLCAEPASRQAFIDHLEEIESEMENSSEVPKEVDINGGSETITAEN